MNSNVVGLDMAKSIFHLYSQTANGKPVKKKLKRTELLTYVAQLAGEPDWHGSLWWCASLGSEFTKLGPRSRTAECSFREGVSWSATKMILTMPRRFLPQ